MSFSNKDRSILAKAVASLPKNAPGRAVVASLTSKVASELIVPFGKSDWNAYAGSESWYEGTPEQQEPFIANFETTIPWDHVSDMAGRYAKGVTPTDKWGVVLIGDSQGIELELWSDPDYAQGPMFTHSDKADPEEILALMKGAIRSLKSGKIPSWLKAYN